MPNESVELFSETPHRVPLTREAFGKSVRVMTQIVCLINHGDLTAQAVNLICSHNNLVVYRRDTYRGWEKTLGEHRSSQKCLRLYPCIFSQKIQTNHTPPFDA